MKKSEGFETTGFLETGEEHTTDEVGDKMVEFFDGLGWKFTGIISAADEENE